MKLIIQIPCFNERDQLPSTMDDLPRQVPGVDEIEVLIIDDGSTDGTSDVARRAGADHIIRFPQNRGLAAAYMAGLAACVRLGADIVVNTDADNQYSAADIPALVEPILNGQADMVIGDRQTRSLSEFSPAKRLLQRLGTWVCRRSSGVAVNDATSGFRAISRVAASQLFVHNRFTYTLETLYQSGSLGLAVENVPVRTNPKTRESRLFRSVSSYIRRSLPVMFHSCFMYRPFRFFGGIATLLLIAGTLLVGRFFFLYLQNPDYSGHTQSLVLGVGSIILAFLVGLFALVAHLIACNRRLLEDMMAHMRRLKQRDAGSSWQQLEFQSPAPDSRPTDLVMEVIDEEWTAPKQPVAGFSRNETRYPK